MTEQKEPDSSAGLKPDLPSEPKADVPAEAKPDVPAEAKRDVPGEAKPDGPAEIISTSLAAKVRPQTNNWMSAPFVLACFSWSLVSVICLLNFVFAVVLVG